MGGDFVDFRDLGYFVFVIFVISVISSGDLPSRVAVVLNTGGAVRCDGYSQRVESFRSVVELLNFAKCGQNSKKLKNCKFWEFGESG